MTPADILGPNPDVVAREVSGEMVLMHIASGTYFGLNPVGARIWSLISSEPRSIANLASLIAQEFDAPDDVIARDVLSLAQHLGEHALVTVTSA